MYAKQLRSSLTCGLHHSKKRQPKSRTRCHVLRTATTNFNWGRSMTRYLVCVLLTAAMALGTAISSPSAGTDQNASVTFNKDVLPILQKNCQTCHRPGEVAPMSFLTYDSTRPWAKAIKAAVLSKKMPPWFADPHVGQFRNAPKLTPADVAKLTAWVDNGAPEGNEADKPSPREDRKSVV